MPAANPRQPTFNGTAHGIAQSNTTSQYFLGSRQPSWMSAQRNIGMLTQSVSSTQERATSSICLGPGLIQTSPSQLQPLMSASPQYPVENSPLPHPVRRTQIQTSQPQQGGYRATSYHYDRPVGVISDHNDGRGGASMAQSVVGMTDAPRVNEQYRKRSMDATAAELNKRLRLNSAVHSPAVTPSPDSSTPLSGPPSVAARQDWSQPNQEGTRSAFDEVTITVAPTTPASHRQQGSIPPPTPQAGSVDVSADNAHHGQHDGSRVQGAALMSSVYTQVIQLSNALETWLSIRSSQGSAPPPGCATWRIEILRNALLSHDVFFLCLHQVYCLASVKPYILSEVLNYSHLEMKGLQTLKVILVDNMLIPGDVLNFLATFPVNLICRQTLISAQYLDWFRRISVFLQRFGRLWEEKRDLVLHRYCPPWPEEVAEWFGTVSTSVQSLLWTLIHRQLGGHDEASWTASCRQLFSDAQEACRHAGMGRPSSRSPRGTLVRTRTYQRHRLQGISASQGGIASYPLSAISTGNDSPQASGSATRSPTHHAGPQGSSQRQATHENDPTAHQPDLPVSTQRTVRATPTPTTNPPPRSTQTSVQMGHRPMQLSERQLQQFWQQRQQPTQPQAAILVSSGPSNQMGVNQNLAGGRQGIPIEGQAINIRPAQTVDTSGITDIPGYTFLIPPPEAELPQSRIPMPSVSAIHQSYLNSPIARNLDRNGAESSGIRLYQYLRAFAMAPVPLGTNSSFYRWSISIHPAYLQRKAILASSATLKDPPKRWYIDGSVVFRLRCVVVGSDTALIQSEHTWSASDNTWPSSFFVNINGHDLEARRKLHHPRDLPIDLTDHVTDQENVIEFSILRNLHEYQEKSYAVAMEVVEIGDDQRVLNSIRTTSKEQSLRTIRQILTSRGDDDDIVLVDPHLSIDLVDPFMATIFKTPVRGVHCLHRECFDLDTFLQTRKSHTPGNPTSADEWKCPICKTDARPQSLLLDGFLQDVRQELERRNALDTKAILVKADGTWEVKRDVRDETGVSNTGQESSGAAIGVGGRGFGRDSVAPNIIELDDDD